MSIKNYILFIGGMIVGMVLILPFLKWLGIPLSFANVLVYMFGEPDNAKKIIVSLFLILLVSLIVLIPKSKYMKSS
ncbi:hypothetical protein [Psychrobacillus psychrodurans]|uniref:hypothetical protein n=1 Tax=Psychrobacillus psychrodurans TaxID=126157 RepID=UPI0008F15FCD|nr:hypothetical protein [Psychrobacillus psychrodurans]MCZ8539789.1 hypothetical protein [Psychrobacillus psychrodurans]SFM92462.1 hypothetical protein SAMN05421832_10953 [Psychrobacillus psychrodurans]